jgi:DNA polymerase III epsilon subunit-like protein
VVLADGESIVDCWQSLVRPSVPLSKGARKVTGLTDAELKRAPGFRRVAEEIRRRIADRVVVSHNVMFDLGYLHRAFDKVPPPLEPPVTLDTLEVSRRVFAFPKNGLEEVCRRLGVDVEPRHRALADAKATFAAYHRMLELLDPDGALTVDDVQQLLSALAPNSPYRLRQKRILREAHRDRVTVWVDYQSTGDGELGLVHREVAVWFLRLPYVQGWCFLRDGERVFRLDRMRAVARGTRSYDVPTGAVPRV